VTVLRTRSGRSPAGLVAIQTVSAPHRNSPVPLKPPGATVGPRTRTPSMTVPTSSGSSA